LSKTTLREGLNLVWFS